MQIKKLSAVAVSALMATTAMLPMSAFATQTPSVEYTGGNGDPITHLYLIADDANLANNNTFEWNQTNAKVEVPVAINYVAQANGTIEGPSDTAAQIRNFAGFPVNVSNILVTAGQNVTLVSAAADADSADEIYLQMKPNSGTIVSMADFTASATETVAGSSNGTGKRPTAGAEWNIAAAQSGVGTSSAVPSVLNLNSLGGKIGGFANLNPSQKTEIGQIAWTITPGTVSGTPALPSTSTFASTSVADFAAIGNYLRSGNADSTYVNNAKALVGQTMNVTLANEQTMTMRLVSVDTSRGLTFEATDILLFAKMNSTLTAENGWAGSDLRTSMNSGEIYNEYFKGTEFDDYAQGVNHTGSLFNTTQLASTQGDRYWVPSMNNLFGSNWWSLYGGFTDGSGETQFDCYAAVDPALDSDGFGDDPLVKTYGGSANAWWTLSGSPVHEKCFVVLNYKGSPTGGQANQPNGVVPCFCL